MRAEATQQTIAHPCTVSGRGYWTGQANTLTFLPAAANSGITFFRSDIIGNPSARATTDTSSGMALRTRVSVGRAEFDMVEHVMAALFGLGIDNVEVHCTACEMPAMDGSSLAFTLALESVGLLGLEQPRNVLRIQSPIHVGSDEHWILAEPSDSEQLELEYRLDYGSQSAIGRATYRTAITAETFAGALAPARTFISMDEARLLQAEGLCRHVTPRDLLVFDTAGLVDNRLRFPDECARHKTLDLLGDLALTGINLIGRITACKSGHQLNAQMARLLREQFLATILNSTSTELHEHAA